MAQTRTPKAQLDSTLVDTTQLATKQNLVTLTTTGTSGAATFNQSTGALNIPSYAGGGGSGITRSIITFNTATSAGATASTDYVYICTSVSPTLTLPTAVGNTNRYDLKNSGTGVLNIVTTSSQLIDQYTDIQLIQYQGISIVSNNSNWVILAS